MKLNESQKIMKLLNESLDYYDDIVSDVVCGDEVYVRLDEKDYSPEEGSDIYLIHYADFYDKPEAYDEGYITGWDRGQDEEYDKKQDERFARATKAYENGEVFDFDCVKIENDKIKKTGFCLLTAYGEEELKDNLEYFKAKRINVIAKYSFEEGE